MRTRWRRVDCCLARGGWWTATDLMLCTGLGPASIYLRTAKLEREGLALSEKAPNGQRRWMAWSGGQR